MEVKRFHAPDMRQAIRRIREELGPDAVILSNRRVADGIEILAAREYEAEIPPSSLAGGAPPDPGRDPGAGPARDPVVASIPGHGAAAGGDAGTGAGRAGYPAAGREDGAEIQAMRREIRQLRGLLEKELSQWGLRELERRDPERAELTRRLQDFGLRPRQAGRLAAGVEPGLDADAGWWQALGQIARELPVEDDPILDRGGLVALVGPTGVGKTTTVAKLAARYALRHGRRHVALISTDNYRIGAHDQLQTYGRLLGIPVYTADTAADLAAAVEELGDTGLVLVDSAGMGQRDRRLRAQMDALTAAGPALRSYLVLAANTAPDTLAEVTRVFAPLSPGGCILTKVDEAVQLGGVMGALLASALPLSYVCDGQRVPEDLHPARAHTLVSRAAALAEAAANEQGDAEEAPAHAHV